MTLALRLKLACSFPLRVHLQEPNSITLQLNLSYTIKNNAQSSSILKLLPNITSLYFGHRCYMLLSKIKIHFPPLVCPCKEDADFTLPTILV